MAGDRGIGGVGQPPLAQPPLLPAGALLRAALGEKALEDDPPHLGGLQAGAQGAGEQPGAASRQHHRELGLARRLLAQDALLQLARLHQQLAQLAPGQPAAAAGQARLQGVGEGQVDIVAAEQQVVADRHPAQGQTAGGASVGGDLEQAEIGGAAADVAHQHAGAAAAGTLQQVEQAAGVAPPPEPVVKGRLRLLDQPHRRITGEGRRLQGELLRRLVEGGGDGDHHLLGVEHRLRPAGGHRRVPHPAQPGQVAGARLHRRQALARRHLLGLPGEDRRRAVDGGMREPGFGRVHHPPRLAAHALAGQQPREPSHPPAAARPSRRSRRRARRRWSGRRRRGGSPPPARCSAPPTGEPAAPAPPGRGRPGPRRRGRSWSSPGRCRWRIS